MLSDLTNAKIVQMDELYKVWEGGERVISGTMKPHLKNLNLNFLMVKLKECKMLTPNKDIVCKNNLNHCIFCNSSDYGSLITLYSMVLLSVTSTEDTECQIK